MKTRPQSSGLLSFLCMVLLGFAFVANATSPVLSIVTPRGGQRGTEVEMVFHGERLGDAQEILFYEPGITTVSLNSSNAQQLRARLKLTSDARLGQHVVRVRTAGGITEARTISIGQYPVVTEMEPNNDFGAPQKIALNSTVHGVAGNEDIDYFQVEAKKGERITAEVEAMRLGSALVDCFVAIMDLKRFELAVCDDSALALQDPVASVIAPEDGVYVIAVRESSYAGSDGSRYCLHVGGAPRPTGVYPAGGKSGDELELTFLGDVRGSVKQIVKLPPQPVGDFNYYLVQDGQWVPSPNRIRVVEFGNALEVEPNDTGAALGKAPTNSVPELPLAFNGIIEREGDVDFFRFRAKAAQKFDVRCLGRAIQSPLDSVLAIHKADGSQLAENDDSGGPDSSLNWTVPADGEYMISVRDHLRKGGSSYVYRVEFSPVKPSLTLGIPEFARNSQERNAVAVPRGNRMATLFKVSRANFGGDVALSAPELPDGLTLACDTIAASVNETPVVFEATTNAPLASRLMPITGQQGTNPTIRGGFQQSLELIYGEPNNTIYYKTTVERVAIAVTEEAPFRITVVEPKVPLVQNGSMNLRVVAERKDGFKAAIKLRMLWNPPGVGSQNEVVIGENQTEAVYPINANSDAATRTWKIAILASADTAKGVVWTSSQLASLTIGQPFLAMQIPMAAGEQGQPVPVVCKLQQLQPFDGEAQVQLVGLPPKVELVKNPLTVTHTNQEIVFQSNLAKDAPVGQHKTLFCQVTIVKNGEPIAHNIGGGGVLRIDAPPPPKPTAPAPAPGTVAKAVPTAAPAAVAAAAPPKPLSRLEKLRLEAREKSKTQ